MLVLISDDVSKAEKELKAVENEINSLSQIDEQKRNALQNTLLRLDEELMQKLFQLDKLKVDRPEDRKEVILRIQKLHDIIDKCKAKL